MSKPYNKFQLAAKYLNYWTSASNSKGHGVHSPFVFDLITQVLNNRSDYYYYDSIEALRERLLLRRNTITVEDFGAGSGTGAGNQRTVGSIAKNAAKPSKYGQLLFRLANYYQPSTIIELGTSLGLSTAYLAAGNLQAKIVTIEGSPEIAGIARENFQALGLNNIHQFSGNFDDLLDPVLAQYHPVDMVFIDGNHRQEPTERYFRQILPHLSSTALLIFDDIHWSPEMEAAWKNISTDPRVMLSIDLFFIGMVFFNPSFLVQQHFRIRF